eukprot:jgi/Pico_ML_1/50533/g1723.t1
MLAIREQWVQEVGTSPPGLGAEMKLWQIPVEGLDEEALAKKAFAFLLYKKVQRQTEGLMETTQFPINYFAISELEQWFPDFRDVFEQQPTGDFWRFHRVHGYGSQIESDKYLKLGPE